MSIAPAAGLVLAAMLAAAGAGSGNPEQIEMRLETPCPPSGHAYTPRDGMGPVCLERSPLWKTSDVTSATWRKVPEHLHYGQAPTSVPEVTVWLSDKAAARTAAAMKANIGKRLGILIHGELVIAPALHDPSSGHSFRFSGITQAEAEDLVAHLNARQK